MKLVVGLGNIGKKYENTRHNIGFFFLDEFAKEKGLVFKKEKKYYLAEYKNLYLMKPTTYMNLSGIAVTSHKTKYGFDDILVIVDDINLPFAVVRIRESGGDGGHNGLKSITQSLGHNKYKRIRVGVGNTEKDLVNYVLSKFTESEQRELKKLVPFMNSLLDIYADKGFKEVLDFNSKNNPILKNSLESKDQRSEV